ncbi:MAG TPA: ThuA domain-containing protein [Clostridia bacterium]|nr:ThuA domain-containing protein [Clostridia bacterium]
MTRSLGSIFLGLTLVGMLAGAQIVTAAEPAKTIKVLLVTGDDVSPAHNWREVSQAIRETLVAAGKFDVRVCEDTGVLDSAATLGRYDLVFLHYYNAKTPTLSAAAKENLAKFVGGGKGMVVSHLSSASFKEWDEFRKMCGRYWVMGQSGHGPRSVFKAKIAMKDHPITQGLSDFEADDELYAKLQGDAPVTVLVEAASDWSKKTEALAFTVEYGQGRVFHETFGHDGKAIQNASVQKLLQRGSEWAATGKVE